MNLKDLAPKYFNLEKALEEAKNYEGTFAELKDLYLAGKIKLLVNNNYDIIGISVSGASNLEEDNVLERKFNAAYGNKPVMYWLELICKGEEPKVVEEEVDDYYGEELPSDVEASIDDLNNDVSFSSIRNYLKRKYGYCLARGIRPEVEVDDDIVYINDIVWGRKLSDSEYEAL